jgi:hypothetical protein
MMKTFFSSFLICLAALSGYAQSGTDTVVVELSRSSRVMLIVSDPADLPLLRQYDFQALFDHLLNKIESNTEYAKATDSLPEAAKAPEEVTWDDDEEADYKWREVRIRRTYTRPPSSVSIDFGLNNYLAGSNFPAGELYEVRPWGSWYIGVNTVQRTRVSSKFYLEWGLGMSWYNFKFQNDNIRLSKTETGVVFQEDLTPDRGFRKSKLTANYIQASFVPLLDLGGSGHKVRFWDADKSRFRLGIGPYAAYRIGSHSKIVYNDGGGREKDKDRDSFHLENLRYGIRLQVGVRSTDLFFNYDLNNLFNNKPDNPRLRAISFGIIF